MAMRTSLPDDQSQSLPVEVDFTALPGTRSVLTVLPPDRPDSLRLYRLQAN
jgi:hypothetical protein